MTSQAPGVSKTRQPLIQRRYSIAAGGGVLLLNRSVRHELDRNASVSLALVNRLAPAFLWWEHDLPPSESAAEYDELRGVRLGVAIIQRPSWQDLTVGVRFWFLTLILSVLPLLWLRSRRIGRWRVRLANNLCSRCDYDLRATPDRCPECGAVPPGR